MYDISTFRLTFLQLAWWARRRRYRLRRSRRADHDRRQWAAPARREPAAAAGGWPPPSRPDPLAPGGTYVPGGGNTQLHRLPAGRPFGTLSSPDRRTVSMRLPGIRPGSEGMP